MRTFNHPNFSKKAGNDSCLICKKQDDKPVVLIGIVGTKDGGNIQAKQVHLDCIDLLYYPDSNILAQKL